jgi:hypothetical protein
VAHGRPSGSFSFSLGSPKALRLEFSQGPQESVGDDLSRLQSYPHRVLTQTRDPGSPGLRVERLCGSKVSLNPFGFEPVHSRHGSQSEVNPREALSLTNCTLAYRYEKNMVQGQVCQIKNSK